jgi:3-methyladenine DNA glycosylase AlkD
MATVQAVVTKLKALSKPGNLAGLKRFAIVGEGRLGLSMPDIRALAKELGNDHKLALGLWQTGIPDARILAGLIADPTKITATEAESWVKDFNSWDVCDQVCGSVLEKAPFAWHKVGEWAERDEEFVKRASFALLASLAWHDKQATDQSFIDVMPVIIQAATDDRNFVKKAVNWALRNIGKRNSNLNRAAINTAREIQKLDSKTARWIAADAIRELQSEAVQKSLNK